MNIFGCSKRPLGMTLIELIVGLAIASLMTITGWRAIDGLQSARDQTVADSARWQGLDTFFATLEADLRRADLKVFRGDANSLSFKLLGNTAAEPSTDIRYTFVAGATADSSLIRRDAPQGSLTFAEVKNGAFTYRRPPETDPAKPAVTGFESAMDRYPRAVQIELILQSASAVTADAERSVSRLMVLR
jgi:prepilin-type N-terminal cleavage/methylation domain-containing protein